MVGAFDSAFEPGTFGNFSTVLGLCKPVAPSAALAAFCNSFFLMRFRKFLARVDALPCPGGTSVCTADVLPDTSPFGCAGRLPSTFLVFVRADEEEEDEESESELDDKLDDDDE